MSEKLISANRVFAFCGVTDDQRQTQESFIDTLIVQVQRDFEHRCRRSLTSVDVTAETFHNGKNCEITNGNKLRLIGRYRDMYDITAITEEGTALTKSTAYNDGNNWIYYEDTGIIKKISGNWSTENNAIVITGKYGYLDRYDSNEFREDVKKLLTEMVAAKSGLWKTHSDLPDGNITSTRTAISKDSEKAILTHKNLYL